MPKRMLTVDAAVVGAGAAGAAAAFCMARAGLSVALVEQQPFTRAGARWINGVTQSGFRISGIPEPEPPELVARDFTIRMVGALHTGGHAIDSQPLFNIDMRHYVARLHGLCREVGVTMLDRVQIAEIEFDGERPAALNLERLPSQGGMERYDLHALLFVDATGFAGALRRRVPALDAHCPPVPNEHLCSAMQEECEIADTDGALEYLDRLHAKPGDMINVVSSDGGFSTTSVHVSRYLDSVGLLTGAIANGRHATGPQLMARLKQQEPWIGRGLSGGSGLIPLRRPYDRQGAPGIALIGDAACHVFPPNGSGTAAGMIAARFLADAVATADDPGGLASIWRYQHRIHTQLSVHLASYDLFRRLSQKQDAYSATRLIESNLISAGSLKMGLYQKLAPPPLSDFGKMLGGMLREPRLTATVLPTLLRIPAVATLYRAHPKRPNLTRLKAWSHAVARLFGDPPDLR